MYLAWIWDKVCKLIHSDLHVFPREKDKIYDIIHGQCNNDKAYGILSNEMNTHPEN